MNTKDQDAVHPDAERNITAFFDTRDAAEQAIVDLTETGLPRERILLRVGTARKPCVVDDDKGLLQEVKELVLPSDTPDAAVETLRREGFILTVRSDPAAHDTLVIMLERDGGIGIDSRDDIWPGWKSDPAKAQPDLLVRLDRATGRSDAAADVPLAPQAENDPEEAPDPPPPKQPQPDAEARS